MTARQATEPDRVDPLEVPDTRAALVWSFPGSMAALSSAAVGGGTAALDWVLNVGVTAGYRRTDLGEHGRDVASRLGLAGTGAVLFTAADVTRVVRHEDGGVVVHATVGVTKPTWAAAPDDAFAVREGDRWIPGTINTVVQVPVALAPAAGVNAIVTATEAKAQALFDAGVPGTGTASDALVICWPPAPQAEPFAGPRSTWGARLARAVHGAIATGLRGTA